MGISIDPLHATTAPVLIIDTHNGQLPLDPTHLIENAVVWKNFSIQFDTELGRQPQSEHDAEYFGILTSLSSTSDLIPVPEPTALPLLASGLALMGWLAWRKNSALL